MSLPEYGEFAMSAYQDASEYEKRYSYFRDEFDVSGKLYDLTTDLSQYDFHGIDGKAGILFEALLDHSTEYMSFSQRKFIGFRSRFEFDQKRILLASKKRITLLGYHP